MSDSHNIRVVTRIRPLSGNEKSQGCTDVIKITKGEKGKSDPQLSIGADDKTYIYDDIFPTTTTTSEVYTSVLSNSIPTKLLKGYNLTILAYGQTGSGKTYTMGTNWEDGEDGVIPCAVSDLFKHTAEKKDEATFEIKISYLEIYNEEIKDLLQSNTKDAPTLRICEDLNNEINVSNLTYTRVSTPSQVSQILQKASLLRSTGSTSMNATSSRSHAICTIYVESTPRDGSDVTTSKLTLVDLAGSERQKRTNATGERLKEGININKGLFVLGKVVAALSEESSPNGHVPYRDSKLTRLLTSSLGGNSLTVMLCCVSPADINAEESSNTLRYAMRARNIKNEATVNTVATAITPQEAAKLRRENQVLKLQLLQAQMDSKVVIGSSAAPGEAYSVPGSVVDLDRLDIVMKLRGENASLRERVAASEKRIVGSAEESLQASLTADKWKWKYEQVLEMGRLQGVRIDVEHFQDNDTVEDMRLEIQRLKEELQDAKIDAAVAKATAEAVVMGDGNLTAAEEMALRTQEEQAAENDENSAPAQATKATVKMATELNEISGNIQEKEKMAAQLEKERESMQTLKTHFTDAMKSLQDEVEVLNQERSQLLDKINAKPTATSKPAASSASQAKMKARLEELQGKIKKLQSKSSEHQKAIRLRDMAEKKCKQLQNEISEDKRRRAALQRKMKEEAEGRRNEKKAAEMKAMRMLREGEKLKIELNKVREAAAKQANVLKRKAAEALAKQRIVAEQRKRQAIKTGAPSYSNANSGSGIDKTRRKDLKIWMSREIDNMSMVMSTKEQLNEQATLRAAAAKKRESFADKRGTAGVAQQVKMLDVEVETRTGVICQLQRSLMELEREAKTNTLNVGNVDAERFTGMNRTECKFMLHQLFDELISSKLQVENLQQQKNKSDEDAVDKAIETERAKGRKATKKLKFEHSEAMMTLLEGTKGVVEHRVGLQVMEAGAGGVVDADLKSSVDEMLGDFFEGFTRVGDELFNEFESLKEDDRKEKERLEKKLQLQKEKKKMKKVVWRPKEEEDDIFDDDLMDDEEVDDEDDSDWGETPVKKKAKKEKKNKANMDTSVIEDEIVQMLSDDADIMEKEKKKEPKKEKKAKSKKPKGIDETNGKIIEEAVLDKMKVAELKEELKKRGLLVGGKKDELQKRLRDFFAEIGENNVKEMDISADSSLNTSIESNISTESSTSASADDAGAKPEFKRRVAGDELSLTPYAQKVKKVYLFDKAKKEGLGEKPAASVLKKVVHLGGGEAKKSISGGSSTTVARPFKATSTISAPVTARPAAITSSVSSAPLSKDDRMKKLQQWRESQKSVGGSSSSSSFVLPKKASSSLGGTKRRIEHAQTQGEGKKRKETLDNVTNKMHELSKVMNGLEKTTKKQGGFRNTPTKAAGDRGKFNF